MEPLTPTHPFVWGKSILHVLAEGAYALARFAKPTLGGHTWQEWIHRLMTTSDARQVQGPGAHHLFDSHSASGLAHELDGACVLDVAVVLEAKDESRAADKTQIDSFDGKTFDHFETLVQWHRLCSLHRMMCCTHDIPPKIHSYAARKGIIMVGPDRVPLPTLLAAAERWDADDWFPERLLSEFVSLAERGCRPIEAQLHGLGAVCSFKLWSAQECADLDYLHQLASERWLDWLDREHPLHYERHAAACVRRIDADSELRTPPGLVQPT